MEKTATEIDDLRNGSIKAIVIGSYNRSARLGMESRLFIELAIDGIVCSKRYIDTDAEASLFIELANDGGMPITIE